MSGYLSVSQQSIFCRWPD